MPRLLGLLCHSRLRTASLRQLAACCADWLFVQHMTQLHDLSVPHLSCSYVDITTYLLSKGADATLGSQKGDTALHMAARTAHAACITRLLTYRVLSPEGQPTR